MAEATIAQVQAALRDEGFIQLVTFRKSGAGVPTPIWFALHGDRIYFMTMGSAGKVKRIRNNPRVQLRACDRAGNPKPGSAVFDGSARVLGGDEAGAADQALTRKYGWQKRLFDIGFGLTGRSKDRVFVEIVPA